MYYIDCKDTDFFIGKAFTSITHAKTYLLMYFTEYEEDSEREICKDSENYKVKVTQSYERGHKTIYFEVKKLEVDPRYDI